MQEYYHITPIDNVELIMVNGLLPQVGERAAKVNEDPGVFLFPTYEDCETALMGWLGDEFEGINVTLISLKITLPDDFPIEKPTEWERIARQPIPPQYITFYKIEG